MSNHPLISLVLFAIALLVGGAIAAQMAARWSGEWRPSLVEEAAAPSAPVAEPIARLAAGTKTRQITPAASAPAVSAGTDSQTRSRFNDAFDLPLIQDGQSLWDESAARVARRLGLKVDTRTKRHAVYSSSHELDSVLGARPENILLYGLDNKVDEIVISFGNRGSYPPKDFKRRLAKEEEAVRQNLQFLLGPRSPERRQVSPGGPEYDVLRWETREAEITLYRASNDFVAVRLRDAANDPLSRPFDPQDLAKGVLRFQRGDVLIPDIPIVKQGMRPYCVPVTVERVLRHVELPNHMYALAGAAEVSHMGCDSFLIFAQLEQALKQRGLAMEMSRTPLKGVNDQLKASIDQGLPVIWLVHGYHDIFLAAHQRRVARESSASTMAWGVNLNAAANFAKVNRGQYHACVVNGYNERTGEISVIDEIGQFWVSDSEAAKVSMPFVFYVTN